eukprot:TRINITY_DN4261_c0_g1_i4.p1 TRINITY_DN4261_c0_g1~~TRINITY_DN4261_c0_g1_i4.p1  ORF type:complete len:760 (-),score=211.20 TRINITY_DN4261_c0_g1_i4:606-2885(-)
MGLHQGAQAHLELGPLALQLGDVVVDLGQTVVGLVEDLLGLQLGLGHDELGLLLAVGLHVLGHLAGLGQVGLQGLLAHPIDLELLVGLAQLAVQVVHFAVQAVDVVGQLVDKGLHLHRVAAPEAAAELFVPNFLDVHKLLPFEVHISATTAFYYRAGRKKSSVIRKLSLSLPPGFQLGQHDFAHAVLLDLAHRGHGELSHEAHPGRQMVLGQPFLQKYYYFSLFHDSIPLELDPAGHLLAQLVVGHPKGLHRVHRRVLEQHLLDVGREHNAASLADHLLEPAGYTDVAFLVQSTQVAGVQPARGVDGLGRLGGHVKVAGHHIAPGAYLAHLARPQGIAAARVHDLGLRAGHRAAHGGDPELQGVVRAAGGYPGAGLGLAVADEDVPDPHFLHHPVHHLDGALGPGHDPGAQAAAGHFLVSRVVHHGDERGGRAVQGGAVFLDHGLEDSSRLGPAGGYHQGRALDDPCQGDADAAEHMAQGHRNHQAVLFAQALVVAPGHRGEDKALVGAHHPLGASGGARGVEQGGHVAWLNAVHAFSQGFHGHGAAHLHGLIPGQGAGRALFPQNDDPPEGGQFGAVQAPGGGLGQLGAQLGQGLKVFIALYARSQHQSGAAGLAQLVGQFFLAKAGIHTGKHQPGLGRGVHYHQPQGIVGSPQGHALTRPQAQAQKSTGQLVAGPVKFGVGQAHAAGQIHQGLALSPASGHFLEHSPQGQGPVIGHAHPLLGVAAPFFSRATWFYCPWLSPRGSGSTPSRRAASQSS